MDLHLERGTASKRNAPSPDPNRITKPQMFALVSMSVLGRRPRSQEQAIAGVVAKGLATPEGRLTEAGLTFLEDKAAKNPIGVAVLRRRALLEDLDLNKNGPTADALLVLGGHASKGGIGYFEAVPFKIQQAMLRRGLLGADGDLTALGRKAAEALLKQRLLE